MKTPATYEHAACVIKWQGSSTFLLCTDHVLFELCTLQPYSFAGGRVER